jgi:hypothetical protein
MNLTGRTKKDDVTLYRTTHAGRRNRWKIIVQSGWISWGHDPQYGSVAYPRGRGLGTRAFVEHIVFVCRSIVR